MKLMAEGDINKGAIENLKASMDDIKPNTKSPTSSTGPKDDTMSPGTAVVITIGVIAIVAILILVVVVTMRRKKRIGRNNSNMNPLISSSPNYQSVGNVGHE